MYCTRETRLDEMMRFDRACAYFALLLIALSVCAFAEKINDIRPQGYVTDLAGVIDPATRQKIELLATEVEQKTGAQIAVVTVNSLEGQTREDYAADLYKHLGIGSKGKDNGALILIAPQERQYKIEIGYGLEPVINDARAGDAGRLAKPYFRDGDYSSGITAAAWQLAKYIADDKGVTLTGTPQLRPAPQKDSDGRGIWILLGIILLVVLMSRSGGSRGNISRGGMGSGWWIGPMIGGGWGGSRGGWGEGGGGWSGGAGGFGGFGGGRSGGGGAGGSW